MEVGETVVIHLYSCHPPSIKILTHCFMVEHPDNEFASRFKWINMRFLG
jgi:hypothetical protein